MGIMIWIRGARLKTLPLAIAPVLIGASLAWRDASERRVAVAVLCGFVALLLQIAANFAIDLLPMDYLDGYADAWACGLPANSYRRGPRLVSWLPV
ncbi:MAG: hypothetical protein ACLR5M_04000 [Bifidobacterium longum]